MNCFFPHSAKPLTTVALACSPLPPSAKLSPKCPLPPPTPWHRHYPLKVCIVMYIMYSKYTPESHFFDNLAKGFEVCHVKNMDILKTAFRPFALAHRSFLTFNLPQFFNTLGSCPIRRICSLHHHPAPDCLCPQSASSCCFT